jgi:hypothetical protein
MDSILSYAKALDSGDKPPSPMFRRFTVPDSSCVAARLSLSLSLWGKVSTSQVEAGRSVV